MAYFSELKVPIGVLYDDCPANHLLTTGCLDASFNFSPDLCATVFSVLFQAKSNWS
jgi:hypothetical protein